MIRFTCAGCARLYKTRRHHAGWYFTCPDCQQEQIIPTIPTGVVPGRLCWSADADCVLLASLATLLTAALVGLALWFLY